METSTCMFVHVNMSNVFFISNKNGDIICFILISKNIDNDILQQNIW